MHRIAIALTIFASLILVGCKRSTQSKESSFFHTFSVITLVAQNASNVRLDCSEGGTGNGFSVQDLTSGEVQSDKTEDCDCKLKAGAMESFSEATLMSTLASDVEKAIVVSGARVIDAGRRSSSSFYFEYALNNRKGRLEIVGNRLPPANYRLEVNLKEHNAK